MQAVCMARSPIQQRVSIKIFRLSEQTIVRNIFLRLTEFGEGTEDTRRRASFDELMSHAEDADEVRAVLNKLAEARLDHT